MGQNKRGSSKWNFPLTIGITRPMDLIVCPSEKGKVFIGKQRSGIFFFTDASCIMETLSRKHFSLAGVEHLKAAHLIWIDTVSLPAPFPARLRQTLSATRFWLKYKPHLSSRNMSHFTVCRKPFNSCLINCLLVLQHRSWRSALGRNWNVETEFLCL